MKRNIVICIVFLCMALAGHAQEPALHFSSNGEFKIVQFTDLHYKWGKKASNKAIECMEEVLDAEKPDFVMVTGDLVYSASVAKILPILFACISERQIPFAVVFGNHDEQFDCTLSEIYDIISAMPYNIQPDRNGAFSPDYALPVMSSDGSHAAAVLYCLDSHARPKLQGIGGYDWLKFDQINWYREQSSAFTEQNGGTPLPSLAFFHIPLPEYAEAEADGKNPLLGSKGENVSCPRLNSGMFTAIKEQGDVIATFCGHDHDNDFAVMYKDILLAYGRFSGGNTIYNHLRPNGARVIVLKENQRTFDTWVRLRGGEVINQMTYPDSFLKSKKKAK
nr:metallophosphoesterase family protein [Bacteroides intestinalis]